MYGPLAILEKFLSFFRALGPHLFSGYPLSMFTLVYTARTDIQPRDRSIEAEAGLKVVPLQGLGEKQAAKDQEGWPGMKP